MSKTIRNRRILILAVIAIAAMFFQFGNSRLKTPEAHARTGGLFTASQVFGLVPGQRARFCVGTLTSRGPAVDWSIPISNERGVLLLLPATHSPAGEWRCLDVPHSSLPVSGEPATGRVQVAARYLIRAPVGTKPADIIGSLEIVNGDGTSAGGAVAAAIIAATQDNDL